MSNTNDKVDFHRILIESLKIFTECEYFDKFSGLADYPSLGLGLPNKVCAI